LFFYYSQLDCHHPDYFPRGRTGLFAGRPEKGDFNRYLDYMDAQLKELLTGYGDVGGIWFDGWWDKPDAEWRLSRTYKLIHDLQPAALVGANHHRKPFPGEDFQMFEKDLPGFNTAGFNEQSEIGELPLEMCETINNSWGYNKTDRRHKSTKDLLQLLVKAAGYDANLLLNVGPMPDGTIQADHVERLRQVGEWLAKNGESIYGTRGGPFKWTALGPGSYTSTHKGDRVFVHVFDWPPDGRPLMLPPIARKVLRGSLLNGGTAQASPTTEAIEITVAPSDRDDVDTIVVLQVDGPASDIPPVGRRFASLAAGKRARASNVFKNSREFRAWMAFDDDSDTRWATDAGTHEAWLEVDLGEPQTIGAAVIMEAFAPRVQAYELQREVDGKWETFHGGTTLGSEARVSFPPVTARKVRLHVLKANEGPTIREFQLLGPLGPHNGS
ncbi:MAG: alpha-L-fucosidase, partial [Planctomycetes bacterium]|nr:alpha-L-fucosidase [Planctomycetota bacterium]